MLMRMTRFLRAPLLALCCLLNCASAAQAAPPALASFFGNPAFSDALLSPDARFLAVKMSTGGARARLAVVDLTSFDVTVVASFKDVDIGDFQWVNPQRLVYDTFDGQLAQADLRYFPGLYAVNRDGSGMRQLASRNYDDFVSFSQNGVSEKMLPWNTALVRQVGLQNSNHVYVEVSKASTATEYDYVSLLRLDTVTGQTEAMMRPGKTQSWLLDQLGQPRIATTLDKDMESVFYRDPANDKWRLLAEFKAYTGSGNGFTPLAFGPDGTFYVSSNAGRDKEAVYPFDFATNRPSKDALIAPDDYDAHIQLVSGDKQLLGVHYQLEDWVTHWFSADMQAVQKSVDALLPLTVNQLSVGARPATSYVLVKSYSDRQPVSFALFNRSNGTLTKVGDSHPDIKAAEMGQRQLVNYPARDGLPIPAWLTLPQGRGGKNLPLVMLVHGGPYVRGDSWRWNGEAQFLASRGYAVLQPEFRGSTGFGYRHYRAGWKQWGLKMQDDIADGAKWAIAQGYADPKRICIAGASYGGYAVLMGLLNDPDLYRCGVEWAGVTDINLMYTGNWRFTSDLSDGWKRYGMPDLVGDQVKDAAQLTATSPLQQAARIHQPLLLAYGGADQRVPLYHGNKFRDAVQVNNKNVEWILYEEEGHGWALPKNRIDFWGKVEKFLAKNIGAP